ncbi:MAG TPA: nitrate reductase molybdenum cofactor assembly chaperone [Solirubrobacteraceae bacterium]|nr:nitrate reductase molybdenum cofactor assembly chaperone [Solirubrobacteraceae bacterium]
MRLRDRHAAAAATTYKLCSLLLCYPDAELLDARAALVTAVEALAGDAARPLQSFARWWAGEDPISLQQHYVETFDLHKRCGLYLTFYGEGDRRARGLALLRLKRMYRAAGLPLHGTELPDYLPVMLEFAATAPAGQGQIVLREHRAALELVRESLRTRDSPYWQVLEAICVTVGEISAADRARAFTLAAAGPPHELVGLERVAPPGVMPHAEAGR